MAWPVITKDAAARAAASLPDPEAARRAFAWTDARAMLGGLPDGGLNIGHEAADRKSRSAGAGATAPGAT